MTRTIHIPLHWSETVWDIMEKHGRLEGEFPERFMQVCAEVQALYAIAHTVAFVEEMKSIMGANQ